MTDSTKVGGWFRRQGWDGGRMYMWAGSGGGGACGSGSPAKPIKSRKKEKIHHYAGELGYEF